MKARVKKGQLVLTRQFQPAFPVGVPAGAFVTVVGKKKGGQIEIESAHGVRMWVSLEAVRLAGEK